MKNPKENKKEENFNSVSQHSNKEGSSLSLFGREDFFKKNKSKNFNFFMGHFPLSQRVFSSSNIPHCGGSQLSFLNVTLCIEDKPMCSVLEKQRKEKTTRSFHPAVEEEETQSYFQQFLIRLLDSISCCL